jgi:hypothetical protein
MNPAAVSGAGAPMRLTCERTCAACDSDIDAQSIPVMVAGQPVEVCSQACALALGEAAAATAATADGGS